VSPEIGLKTCTVCKSEWQPQTKSQAKCRSTCSRRCYVELQRSQRLRYGQENRKPLPLCAACDEEFKATGPTHKYCSAECRQKGKQW
jgi:hypothetical protein